MKNILVVCTILLFSSIYAQQDFGLKITKELCSENYDGRGYVNNGHKKAADYIANKFQSSQLKSFSGSYLQEFSIPVNTFPDSMLVAVDDINLIPGQDFIVNPSSGSAYGKFTTTFITRKSITTFLSDLAQKDLKTKDIIYVIDTKEINDKDTLQLFYELSVLLSTKTPVIVINDNKFTWGVGREEIPFPIIEIKRDKLPEKPSSITLNIHNKFFPDLTTQNVIGYAEGKKKKKFLVLSAHYDHLGRMGSETYFPGANDNASGIAMLLYLADYYAKNKPKFNIAFMAFGAEEVGILGSKFYTENPLFPLDKIKFLINCDIMGTGDEGITVVNGTLHKKEFKKLASINAKKEYIKKIKIRGRAANSDHYWFSQKQVPSIFVYTMGGITAYHDIYDKSETLPLTEFSNIYKLLYDFIKTF